MVIHIMYQSAVGNGLCSSSKKETIMCSCSKAVVWEGGRSHYNCTHTIAIAVVLMKSVHGPNFSCVVKATASVEI